MTNSVVNSDGGSATRQTEVIESKGSAAIPNQGSKGDPPQINSNTNQADKDLDKSGEPLASAAEASSSFNQERSNSNSAIQLQFLPQEQKKVDALELMDFEERLKKNQMIKKFMSMSPSIPNGFDLNCTNVDDNDFSTIICQAMNSNDHIIGLKEQGYMNLESRLEKHKHVHQSTYIYPGLNTNNLNQSTKQRKVEKQHTGISSNADIRDSLFSKQDTKNQLESGAPEQQKQHQVTEEFLVFKEK